MQDKHLNLLFPQWQGGGPVPSTCSGAKVLRTEHFKALEFSEVDVGNDELGALQNNIHGYSEILEQLSLCHALIARENPASLLTLGGSCDADIPSIAHLSARRNNELTVLWIDAHGDMHTPDSSLSKCFYGMPLRTLLGDGDAKIVSLLPGTLKHSQVLMLGIRDLEEAEEAYIVERGITTLTVERIEEDTAAVLEVLRATGNRDVYIHIDFDVLDPSEFPHVPLPAAGGLSIATLSKLLGEIAAEFHIAGLGLFEYDATCTELDRLMGPVFAIAGQF